MPHQVLVFVNDFCYTHGVETINAGERKDGHVIINFSKNHLEAWADFIPPRNGGKDLTLAYVSKCIEALDIREGIKSESIMRALGKCSERKKPVRSVLIARGMPPCAERQEHFQLDALLRTIKAPLEKKGRIDHKTRCTFIVVEANQVLARKKAAVQGVKGRNIHGKSIPFQTVEQTGLRGGRNTRLENDVITAVRAGLLEQSGDTLNVNDLLEIRGPVGYATGNIVFPGDLVLDGPVADGFTVYCGGSITARGTFDVSNVVSKKDLIVAGGIKGRGKGHIKSGGNLKAKFIENCRIACKKVLSVDSGILNSHVFSMDTIDLGTWGQLVGGEYSAIHRIRVGCIGRKGGGETVVRCGIDYAAVQEKAKMERRLAVLKAKLGKMKLNMPFVAPDDRPPLIRLWLRIQAEGKKLTASIAALEKRVYADEDAVIEAFGIIASGVRLEICQAFFVVDADLRRVRIRLDKTSRKLLAEPL
ncbi:hypothetical protein FACS1894200_09610 [Spirochaetia bacterium]|nr:hypothetical protein FACS1894200_09610 [Spirochaetia bacterium]